MKKSLVALAVLAASGAAMAQSSVTLYGIADLWFGSVKTEAAGASLTQTVLNSGGVNGSRWGMKGSEDLGGGLKANFDFQQGISLDTGAAGTGNLLLCAPGACLDSKEKDVKAPLAFSRQSWVGVSGNFGAVRLGRTTTPFDDVSGSSNGVFDSALAATNDVFKSTGYSARQNNMFYYQAPTMGGFSGAVSYALGEDKTALVDASSTTSLNLTYGAGPLAVQFAYQVEDIANTVALPSDQKFTRLGGSYNFGIATAKLSYGKAENMSNANGKDASEWQVGVDYPVSAALTLSADIARSTDNALAGDNVRDGFGIGAAYTLSKRTFVYGGYRYAKEDFKDAGVTPDSKTNVFAVGVQHRF